jgi:type IV pilus assembly protein PilX
MNSPHPMCAMREQYPAKQRGVVLFFALIALVAMSLAAVALIRSVDTSTIVAGNLAFKQSSSLSADSGMESAISWISTAASLDNDVPGSGYYATSTNVASLTADALWVAGTSAAANGIGIDANGYEATSGNTTRYVIERMCRATGAPNSTNCLFGSVSVNTSGQGVLEAPQAGAITTTGLSPIYRVTARVTGPRNTVTFIQAFIY